MPCHNCNLFGHRTQECMKVKELVNKGNVKTMTRKKNLTMSGKDRMTVKWVNQVSVPRKMMFPSKEAWNTQEYGREECVLKIKKNQKLVKPLKKRKAEGIFSEEMCENEVVQEN